MWMPMDAWRRGDTVEVAFDLPGMDPASVDLTVEQNVLTVKAERRWQPEEGHRFLLRERPQGTFTRQIVLSNDVDLDKIETKAGANGKAIAGSSKKVAAA